MSKPSFVLTPRDRQGLYLLATLECTEAEERSIRRRLTPTAREVWDVSIGAKDARENSRVYKEGVALNDQRRATLQVVRLLNAASSTFGLSLRGRGLFDQDEMATRPPL